ncbi:ATP-dependent nuclease [Granulicella tundricola]|uniref:Uncharacterized protein n=1 Tax=Granulicella tundricola (strain ATCC BAA-1859 / DSM 23138 / MP5ACTX9) TaxID=1198114 RepID=E8X0J5_GRATM|nr:AAA family ATPase [Granulicella tundricola]ADW67859.1 hypothetical protein AciX9_0790 [Granulicella tundricola MP5ACTX9]
MKLIKARIINFRSIEDSNDVQIEPTVTVLVGQNDSGKTGFLQALDRTNSVNPKQTFNPIEDYPRRYLTKYERELAKDPPVVVQLTYSASSGEIASINNDLGPVVGDPFFFSVDFKYGGGKAIGLSVNESPLISQILAIDPLKLLAAPELGKTSTLRQFFTKLEAIDLNEAAKAQIDALRAKFLPGADNWDSLLSYYIYKQYVASRLPQFVYFDDYKLLPGKVNLPSFQQRVAAAIAQKKALSDQDSTVQALLRMAGISLEELNSPTNYETIKAKLESFSNDITDRVFKYWKQNTELDVLFDIKSDANDLAPFNSGNNLYIRIASRRHRMSMPFDRRSKGFIWFFSFIIWFASVKEEVNAKNDLVLLLDEPGLSLHALAQADFLGYIRELSSDYQVIYTTHSPFMVDSDKLLEVRVVQDQDGSGTKISSNLSGSDPKTLFPLQAALGYTIAQNLFISTRNLLVEGPSELLYFKHFSALLEAAKRVSLREDITIVPTGGLDKVATFVSLLGASGLEIVVLHDYEKNNAQNLADIIKLKAIDQKKVRTFSEYRPGAAKGENSPTDIEDLLPVSMYLAAFNKTYSGSLKKEISEGKLPAGERIVDRINRYLIAAKESVRPSGGFNHYLVSQTICTTVPDSQNESAVLSAFEAMFKSVNALFSK